MSTTNEKIGNLISDLRQERGLTQAELARQLKTSQSAINRIERGHQNLSLETLARISDVLQKPLVTVNSGSVNLIGPAREGIAALDRTGVETTAQPAHAIRRRSVRERFRNDLTTCHLLQAIVANGGRGVQPFFRISRLEDVPRCGKVSPYSCETIGLQLQPHR